MIHDDAVRVALTGQLMSAELAQHLKTCRDCRAELTSFRRLEAELAKASHSPPDRAWEEAVVRRLSIGSGAAPVRVPVAHGWLRVAAATLVASSLLAAWMALGPSRGVSTSPPAASGSVQASSPTPAETAWPLYGAEEETTTSLLQACEGGVRKVPQAPSKEMEQYLLPNDSASSQ